MDLPIINWSVLINKRGTIERRYLTYDVNIRVANVLVNRFNFLYVSVYGSSLEQALDEAKRMGIIDEYTYARYLYELQDYVINKFGIWVKTNNPDELESELTKLGFTLVKNVTLPEPVRLETEEFVKYDYLGRSIGINKFDIAVCRKALPNISISPIVVTTVFTCPFDYNAICIFNKSVILYTVGTFESHKILFDALNRTRFSYVVREPVGIEFIKFDKFTQMVNIVLTELRNTVPYFTIGRDSLNRLFIICEREYGDKVYEVFRRHGVTEGYVVITPT